MTYFYKYRSPLLRYSLFGLLALAAVRPGATAPPAKPTAPPEKPLDVTLEIKTVPLSPSLEINSSPDAPPGLVLFKYGTRMDLVHTGSRATGPNAVTRYTYQSGSAFAPYSDGLSPDGRWLIFPVIQSSGNTMEGDYYSSHRIALHDRQTDKLRYGPPQIANGDYADWKWSPDSRFFLYSAENPQPTGLYIYDVQTHRNAPLLRGTSPSGSAFTSNQWRTVESRQPNSAPQTRPLAGRGTAKWNGIGLLGIDGLKFEYGQ